NLRVEQTFAPIIPLPACRVSPEDIIECEERFSKSKKVHQTVRHVAQMNGMRVDELNAKVIWPLYKKHGHALDALKVCNIFMRHSFFRPSFLDLISQEAAVNPSKVFQGIDMPEQVLKSLNEDIQLRLAPQALRLRVPSKRMMRFGVSDVGHKKCTTWMFTRWFPMNESPLYQVSATENTYSHSISPMQGCCFIPMFYRLFRARFDVWCFGYEGINAIRTALKAGEDCSDDDISILIKLVAPPLYVIVSSCTDREAGVQRVQKALKCIGETVKTFRGGNFLQQGEIMVMGGEEEKRLEELLEDEEEDDEYQEKEEDAEEEEDEGMGKVDDELGKLGPYMVDVKSADTCLDGAEEKKE
ncbi:eukaryotic initiation factor-2, alpha subunit, partial [Cardiosporidium cionae]